VFEYPVSRIRINILWIICLENNMQFSLGRLIEYIQF
jgi:hypothetical protein